MKNINGTWQSEFPDKDGTRGSISKNNGLATIASWKQATGGHAMMYLEYIDEMSFAVTKKIHLIAQAQEKGDAKIEILEEEQQVDGKYTPTQLAKLGKDALVQDDRHLEYQFKTYLMSDKQRSNLDIAVARFKQKNINGRYSYSTPGGFIGRITTLPKKRGVNCADFIIKVLKEAGITKLSSDLFNTPKRIAGGSIFK